MDKIEILLCNKKDVLVYKSQIWNLLCICDKDFYPTLSSRENSSNGPIEYFEGLFSENAKFVLAFAEEHLVGFSIFFHNYYEDLITDFTPCNYIKIACVHPSYRGLGIGSRLNRYIEEELPESLTLPYIVRRTWNTNLPQLRILQKFGYNLIHQFQDDRGNNINTVYFAKLIKKKVKVI